jgi:hypothetical protein
VESRRDGQFVYYRTRRAVLEEYMSELMRRTAVRATPETMSTRTKAARSAEVAKRA